jgi:hypothetical protein
VVGCCEHGNELFGDHSFSRRTLLHVVKKKVKWSRYTPWRRLGGEELQLLLILNLGTRWGWVVSVTPRPRFTPGERTPGTHFTGGWAGLRAGLDAEARRKILCFCRGSNPGRPVHSQTLYWLSYPGFALCSLSNYTQRKKLLGRPRRRWVDVTMNL